MIEKLAFNLNLIDLLQPLRSEQSCCLQVSMTFNLGCHKRTIGEGAVDFFERIEDFTLSFSVDTTTITDQLEIPFGFCLAETSCRLFHLKLPVYNLEKQIYLLTETPEPMVQRELVHRAVLAENKDMTPDSLGGWRL